jgi:hypothetical protein
MSITVGKFAVQVVDGIQVKRNENGYAAIVTITVIVSVDVGTARRRWIGIGCGRCGRRCTSEKKTKQYKQSRKTQNARVLLHGIISQINILISIPNFLLDCKTYADKRE